MKRSAKNSWALLSATALAAVLAQGVFAPSPARASCGDYVTMTPTSGHDGTGEAPPGATWFDWLFAAPRTPVRAPCACSQHPPEPGQAPCQGPWCSGNHVPVTTPVTTLDHSRDSWASWWSSFLLSDVPSDRHAFAAAVQDRIHRVRPIFHPPRPV